MYHQLNKHYSDRNKGAVLAGALILLVSLTLIAVTVAYRTTLDELMAANQRDALNAMSIADSGIEAGFAEIKASYPELGTGLCTHVSGNPLATASISQGSYTVIVDDCVEYDPDAVPPVVEGSVVLNSVGTVNGAIRETELLLTYEESSGSANWPSFLANDYIDISGAKFVGPVIHVHSNGRIKVGGAPLTCTSAAVCGTEGDPPAGIISSSAEAGVGFDRKSEEIETANPYPWDLWGQVPTDLPAEAQELYLNNENPSVGPPAPMEIPHVYPPDWQGNATVELTHDCRVVEGPASASPGTEIWDVSSQGVWNGWSCGSSAWEMKSSSADLYSAFYYVHGNVKISASPDSAWTASFVAAGNIEITCCVQFHPYGQTGDPAADNLFLLAGNDIVVSGSPGNITDGMIAAHGQVKLTGSGSHFRGSVLAEDYLHGAGQEVTTNVQTIKNSIATNLINSNVILEGTGLGLTGGGGPPGLKIKGWRELVH
jgi:hypothetical protein